MGAGARAGEGVEAVTGFVDAGVLAAAVIQSDVTLLPYRFATQSGAVVLAQALGSLPVATAAGGIPEQIDDGVTGPGSGWWAGCRSLLRPPRARWRGASPGRWRSRG